MYSLGQRVSRLNHNFLRNTVHFEASMLFEKLQASASDYDVAMIVEELSSSWEQFRSDIGPLLLRFADECGPGKTMLHLFSKLDDDDERDDILGDAQSHWELRWDVSRRIVTIQELIEELSTSISRIRGCLSRSSECRNVQKLDQLLTSLSTELSNLPPEESV